MTKKLTTHGLSRTQLRGHVIVPLLTPFTRAGEIDEPAVARMLNHVMAGGCQGIMVAGTTGEFASMPIRMRLRLMELAVRAASGRLLIFGGIGDTSPAHSIELGREFLRLGAHAVVGNLPSYYPLTPEMMERYFVHVAEAVGAPMYLYNIPQTTKQTIPLEVVERLSHHPLVAGIKDSEPDATRQETLARQYAGRPDFAVFCGSIAFTSKSVRAGADGCVPGAGNFAPSDLRNLMIQLFSGDIARGDAAQQRVDSINATYQKGRTLSQVFIALKAIMEIYGLCSREVLSPLIPASDAEVSQIRLALRDAGLIP